MPQGLSTKSSKPSFYYRKKWKVPVLGNTQRTLTSFNTSYCAGFGKFDRNARFGYFPSPHLNKVQIWNKIQNHMGIWQEKQVLVVTVHVLNQEIFQFKAV